MSNNLSIKVQKELEERFTHAENDISSNSIYFAHPIDIYGTPLEANLIEKIGRKFPGHVVENPAKKHHGENYIFWKKETGNGMNYFARLLNSPKLVGEVFLPFEDGMIGAGVYKEIQIFQGLDKAVWEIDRSGLITPISTIDEARVLSIEDTKARVYSKE